MNDQEKEGHLEEWVRIRNMEQKREIASLNTTVSELKNEMQTLKVCVFIKLFYTSLDKICETVQ